MIEFIRNENSDQVSYASNESAQKAAEEFFTKHPELFHKLAQ